MTSTTYLPHVCEGLFSEKQKNTGLDRAALFGRSTTTFAVGLHKNTSGFTLKNLNENSSLKKFSSAKLDSTRRHAVISSAEKVIFLGRVSASRRDLTSATEESLYLCDMSSSSADQFVEVAGATGRLQELLVLNQGALVVGATDFAFVPEAEFNSVTPKATKLTSRSAPIPNIRNASVGTDGATVLLHNQNQIQVFRVSSKLDAMRLQMQVELSGVGILFAKQTSKFVLAVSDSGATLTKWAFDKKTTNPSPVSRKFTDKLISSACVFNDELILIGHAKGSIEVLSAETLETLNKYSCFPHPDELKQSSQEPVSAVGKKDKRDSKALQAFLEGLVTNIECFGDYIIATTDSAVCVWNIKMNEVASPIKVRITKGKIASKLIVVPSSDNSRATVFVATARSKRYTSQESADPKIASKDLRIDCLVWKLNGESLSNATKRIQKTASYQRALNTLLSRDLSNQLLDDIGFVHRLLLATKDVRADAGLAAALVRLAARRENLSAYLTASVEENLHRLEGYAAEWLKLLAHLTGGAPPSVPLVGFLVRESNFNITFMVDFIRMEGAKYLSGIWSSLFRKMKRASKVDWETDYKVLYSSKRSSGTDKADRKRIRAECKQEAAQNEALVVEWTTKFLDSILNNHKLVPKSIAELLKVFVERSRRFLAEDKAEDIIKAGPLDLMFSKFFVPALASPTLFGLVETPSLSLQLNLGRVSRNLSALATGRVEGHPLAERAADLFQFLCDVIGLDPNKALSPKKTRKNKDATEPASVKSKNISKSIEGSGAALQMERDYFLVNQFIIRHAARLYELEGADSSSEAYALQADTSVVLRKLAKQDLVDIKDKADDCSLFCVKNAEEDEQDSLTPTLTKPDFAMPTQEDLPKKRTLPNENDIPFSTLLSTNPKNFTSLRDWVTDEFQQHSFLVLVFFRGNWCPFCTRYMPSWNKYVSPILKRDGLVVGVSSMSQTSSKKTASNWKIEYPLIGDPFNELAQMFNVDIGFEDKRYKHGMAQPAVVVLSRSGEALYFWKTNASLSQLLGGIDRPRAYNVLTSVISAIKRPSSMDSTGDSSGAISELTERSSTDSSASVDTDSRVSD